MKKIYNAIIVLAALGISAVVSAQTPVNKPGYTHSYSGIGELYFPNETNHDYYGDNEDVGASKNISAPVNGKYYIKLEAFAKGQATKTSEPADFVLVLDVSGSMSERMGGGDQTRRIDALKTAVKSFLSRINENDAEDMGGNPRASRLGNRIAIVTFSSSATKKSDLIKLGSSPSDSAGLGTLKGIIDGLGTGGGTYAHKGMQEALSIINFGDQFEGKTRKLRTVVLFTDGNPGLYGDWTSQTNLYSDDPYDSTWGRVQRRQDTFNSANATITAANSIKNITDEIKGIVSNVFTVSIITNPSTQTKVYLGKTSSNYLNATNMGNWNNTYHDPIRDSDWEYGGDGKGTKNSNGTNYAITATTAKDLKAAFDAIAGIVGNANNNDLTSSSTTVDVVSSSFKLPGTTVDPSLIKVYTVAYKYDKNRTGNKLYFDEDNMPLAPASKDEYDEYEFVDGKKVFKKKTDVDDAIHINENKLADNIIEVQGFDYTNNWCGPIYEDDNIAGAQGHKVVILIPIQMADDAVGGPNILTNAEGSGIFKATGGDAVISFTSPAVSLPVNLSIKKENLKQGENAKFVIKRGILPEKRPDEEDETWHPNYSLITNWDYVTTIIVPNKDGSNEVKIKGLPSTSDEGDYVYQIVEEDWSWTYTFDSATGKGYVKNDSGEIEIKDIEIKDKFKVYSDQFVTNPIIFKNKEEADSETRVRHAESKVTNTFKPSTTDATKGVVTTSDSKTND